MLRQNRIFVAGLGLCLFAGCSRNDPEPARAAAGTSAAPVVREPYARREVDETPGLPARRAIAGIAGFQSSSRIVYASEPGKVHTLSATYLFPERVRLYLSLAQDKLVDRVILYRRGARVFFVNEREASSRESVGPELAAVILQTELRRALFLWPDGFEWRGDDRERSVDLGDLGKLSVRLGPDGRPTAMRSIAGADEPVETLADISWKPTGKRHFPSHFTLSAGEDEQPIWSEDVIEVETALDYVDAFFLPPDRRAKDVPPTSDLSESTIEPIDMPALWELRVPVTAASNVTSARATAESARSTWRERGVAVLEETVLELDRQARPTACLLHAPSAPTPPADGWILRAECPGWSLTLEPGMPVGAPVLESMAVRLPLDEQAVSFQLHFDATEPGPESGRLVLAQRRS